MNDKFDLRMKNTSLIKRISNGLEKIGIKYELKINGDFLQFFTHNQKDCDMAAAYSEMSVDKKFSEDDLIKTFIEKRG